MYSVSLMLFSKDSPKFPAALVYDGTADSENSTTGGPCISPKLIYIQGFPDFESSKIRKPTTEATHNANNSSHGTSDHRIKPSSSSDGGMGKMKKKLKSWSQANCITVSQSSLTEAYYSFNITLNILIYRKQCL